MLAPHRVVHTITYRPSTPAHCCAYAIALFDAASGHGSLIMVFCLFLAEFRELWLDLTA